MEEEPEPEEEVVVPVPAAQAPPPLPGVMADTVSTVISAAHNLLNGVYPYFIYVPSHLLLSANFPSGHAIGMFCALVFSLSDELRVEFVPHFSKVIAQSHSPHMHRVESEFAEMPDELREETIACFEQLRVHEVGYNFLAAFQDNRGKIHIMTGTPGVATPNNQLLVLWALYSSLSTSPPYVDHDEVLAKLEAAEPPPRQRRGMFDIDVDGTTTAVGLYKTMLAESTLQRHA